jgi:hypothetical protein
MQSAALFDLLPDFGARLPHPETKPAVDLPPSHPHAPPAIDVDALIADAVARAETELEVRLKVAHEAALEEQRQANADEASAFLATLGDDVGKMIGERIDAMETQVSALVAATVTRVVGGLLSKDLQKRSLEALAVSIRESIGDAEAVRIDVRGPQSLFETLKTSLGARAANLDFVEAPGFDLTISIDDTMFETRMSEWSVALSEILS